MTKTKSSQPSPTVQQADMAGPAANPANNSSDGKPDDNSENVVKLPSKGNVLGLFSAPAKNSLLHEKIANVSEARQRLAQAYDLYREGDDKADEARAVANKAMLTLYQDRIRGIVSKDEVTAVLGDIFGYKAKKDGSPSKTPDGLGEVLRKRINRAVDAHDYVKSIPENRDDDEPLPEGDGGRFFEGLPDTDVQALLSRIGDTDQDAAAISLWAVYDRTAEIKREHASRTEAVFDPKRVAAMAEKLSSPEAVSIFAGNPALVAAYRGLVETLRLIDEGKVPEQEEAA